MNRNPKRYPAEMLDQFLLFQEDNNDHQIRLVLRFGAALDERALRRALLLSLKRIPVLGCRFVESGGKAYWEEIDRDESDENLFSLVETDDPDAESLHFIARSVDHCQGQQINARLIRRAGGDALCIVVNHMAFDGASLKEYISLLGRLYTDVRLGGGGEQTAGPDPVAESRSLDAVFARFHGLEKLKVSMLNKAQPRRSVAFRFPRESEGDFQPIFICHRAGPERLQRIKECARANGATVNDVVLAAYYRTLYRMIETHGENLRIPCMVDLRRYLPEGAPVGFRNLSSMIDTECARHEGFSDTLQEVSTQMRRAKSSYPGLQGLGLISMAHTLLPYRRFRAFTKRAVAYPQISISNLGLISDATRFGDVEIQGAVVFAALKRTPCFQLTFSTFRQLIVFTVSLLGTEGDREKVERFFAVFDEELP